MSKNHPELRPWNKFVGVSGDLADIIVGVLSWVSISHSISLIRLSDFFIYFDQLSKEFPDLIQELNAVTRRGTMGSFTFSTRLCDSLEAALQIGIKISTDLQHLYIPPETGRLNLERMRRRVRDQFVNNLKPISDRLAELQKGRNT